MAVPIENILIENILFASDLSDNSRYAFQYASGLAARFQSRIVLLHVIQALPSGMQGRLDLLAGEGTMERLRQAHRKEARDVLIGKRTDDLRIRRALSSFYEPADDVENGRFEALEILLREGEVSEEILRAAGEFRCDMIVMGSHKSLLAGTAVGTKSKEVVRRSKVPVLIVPPPQGADFTY